MAAPASGRGPDAGPVSGNEGEAADARASNGAAPLDLEALRIPPEGAQDVQIKLPLSPFASSTGPPISKRRSTSESDEEDAAATNAPMRMVSWQDEIHGRELASVREFEPSEAGHAAEDHLWESEKKKSCCAVM